MKLESTATLTTGARISVCAILLLTACADDDPEPLPGGEDVEVDVTYEGDAPFSEYRTFAFEEVDDLPPDVLEGLDALSRDDLEAINEEVAETLRDQGLSEVDSVEDADLIAFSLAHSDADTYVEWDCVAGRWGGYWGWGAGYDPCAWLEPDEVEITQTTVVVGVVDPEREEAVFTGFIHGIDGTQSERREEIEEGVEEVFDRYPAGPGPEGGVADAGAEDGAVDAGEDPDAGAQDAGEDADAGAQDASEDAADGNGNQ